jgi:hypothetical protein
VKRALVAAFALIALAGCGADPALAMGLANAARPSRLPYVVACWEKEFAVAAPDGGYVATVDFVVQAGTSKFHGAELRSLDPVTAEGQPRKPTGREAALSACLTAALDQSSLPAAADSDGPGFSTAGDLRVKRFRIAFVSGTAKQQENAAASQANVLVGPRVDRCGGLYSHHPPRDASTLYAEIGRAETQAMALHAQGKPGDRDLEARELQKAYDAKLELGERLTADLDQPEIPEANRKRLRAALDEARAQAKKTGARIGCKP